MIWEQFNPYSIETRYSLDYACMLVHQAQPATIRLATDNQDIASAFIHRMLGSTATILVESTSLQDRLKSISTVPVIADKDNLIPDVVIVPFSRLHYPTAPRAKKLVTISYNALSYKSLLYPLKINDHILKLMHWINRDYSFVQGIGLYAPRFLFHWTISVFASYRRSAIHFQQGQNAVDHIYARGKFWWTGFILITEANLRS